MTNYIELSHDPFARFSLVRSLIETNKTCDWCGQKRKNNKLFSYGIQEDSLSGRMGQIKGAFCSIQCMRDYNN